MKYFEELKRAMEFLSKQENTIFIGQAVACDGTGMSNTLKGVDKSKLIEFPVVEDMQMGISNGMAINGIIPISIFPRWNFMLLATNQLVNHLDKISDMSNGGYKPKVIIRTSVGSEKPLHPSHQHVGNYVNPFKLMLKNIDIIDLQESDQIYSSYKFAFNRSDGKSTILVEYGDYYNTK